MKKAIFTFALVAVAAISANAHVPFQDPFGGWLKNLEGASVDKTEASVPGVWKTGHLQAAEKTVAFKGACKNASVVKKSGDFGGAGSDWSTWGDDWDDMF